MLAGTATPLRAAAGPQAVASQRRPHASAPFVHRRPGDPLQARVLRQAQRRLPGGAGGARVVRAAAADPSPEQPGSLPGQLDFPPGTLLGGRYEVIELLGQGSSGVTYRCRDTAGKSRRDVAVKCLSLRSLKGGWKQLELFEREARVLQALKHPGIPHYLACFEQDTERDRVFFLVQEAVKGSSLAAMAGSGWRPDEAEVERIATQLLGTLCYLGSRQPPVVHRDVKPENVVVDGGRSGGKVYLVDFGSVQAAAAASDDPASGATVVGTFGFMAPEQLRGEATPASDLYSLGATLLSLVSGRPPSSFPTDRLRIDFSSVDMGARLRAVLEGLLEPAPEERMGAEEALEVLAGKSAPGRAAGTAGSAGDESVPVVEKRPPHVSKLVARQNGPSLEIVIPPARWKYFDWDRLPWLASLGAIPSMGGVPLLLLASKWTWAVYLALFCAVLLWPASRRHVVRERITVDRTTWKVERQLDLFGNRAAQWREDSPPAPLVAGTESGPTAELLYAYVEKVKGGVSWEFPVVALQDRQGDVCLFGETVETIHEADHKWLAGLINGHLGDIRDGKV